MRSNCATLVVVLSYLKQERGRTSLETITRDDVSSLYRARAGPGHAAQHRVHQVEARLCLSPVSGGSGSRASDLLKRKLRSRCRRALPRAIDPEDIQQLLAVIEKPRDRAMILVLLRAGMRIGELLATRMSEVNLREKADPDYGSSEDPGGPGGLLK